ncbi:STKc_myosinIII_N_like and MYSc_Myo21 domain-containing protein ninaC isoform X1 [Rhynchophorus ferrugineus]|uniref:STKc_myosinIII_N_like and MYSc_Myo21 domain-containing protein ninaC isoform X1 n=1 Tax=Rhynchophorus ferrugineus TaxID=354439 RepID=UPI003FCD2ED8
MKSNIGNLPDPGDKFTLQECFLHGTFGKIFKAFDNSSDKRIVAIKIQKYKKNTEIFIEEEYEILKQLDNAAPFVGFYGAYKKNDDFWFILENWGGGNASSLVCNLLKWNRRICEEHIAHILKETVKGIIYLHENNIIHRNIRASNIVFTQNGEIKLGDFTVALRLKDSEDLVRECVGSPYWMAPEVVTANMHDTEGGFYDNRVDVWGLGITAIEIGEGRTPFLNMHPSRALSQIIKNPPPTLEKVSNWSESFHDFINECLVKNFEHRPYIMEIIEHPFLQEVPENNYHLSLEIKKLIEDVNNEKTKPTKPDVTVFGNYIKRSNSDDLEEMLDEDLADLEYVSEKKVLSNLEKRFKKNEIYSFIGDVLVAINPNKKLDIYDDEHHKKYLCKSRSDNAPHIYAVADSAYQNALHHKIPQYIVFTGESGSGKTTNYLHAVDHLFLVGYQHPINIYRMKNGIKLIHALTHASTPANDYSTRSVIKTSISYGKTGKITGAGFAVSFLDKWRVSSVDMNHSNFHILYYIYDGLVSIDAVDRYKLRSNRNYRYLRIPDDTDIYTSNKPRDNIEKNVIKYKKIFSYMEEFEFSEEQICTFFSIVAAILNLGEIRFQESEDESCAVIENPHFAENVADLLEIDEKKFRWALTNYCLVKKGSVIRKRNTTDEARDTRDVLANNLYSRFVDYVVGIINEKLEIGKTIFGDKYIIKLLDYSGFECFKQNYLPQFFVNCLNEQLQFHYLQRIFSWELQDLKYEDVEYIPVRYFDNKDTLNQLLSKPDGVLSIIDDASRRHLGGQYIMENLEGEDNTRVHISKPMEFAVAHYTGTVSYSAKEMAYKNRDFLPPEIIETMRESENSIIKTLFSKKLDKTGNLILNNERYKRAKRNVNTRKITRANQFSQSRNMRTSGSVFRYLCLDLLKELSVGASSGGTHFVRCIRSNLSNKPDNFHTELIRQQLKAMTIVETAMIRQTGYSQRITFSEFLRRYQFLAFDFDENVDVTKENCRLLLIRLKMEDWAIGRTKVFLKYYNEEYLARLYEVQVKKIIKIQSIFRGFLAKCRLAKKMKEQEKSCIEEIQKQRRSSMMTEEEAAEIIQKAYRKVVARPKISPTYQPLNDKEFYLAHTYAKKWRNSSIFHVLMQYRGVKLRDFYNFCQQVHLYNQNVFDKCRKIDPVDLDYVDGKAQVAGWLGVIRPAIVKTNFRLDEIPFFDTSKLCDPLTNIRRNLESYENWDSPYQWRLHQVNNKDQMDVLEKDSHLTSIPYVRDEGASLIELPSTSNDASPVQVFDNVGILETEGVAVVEQKEHDVDKFVNFEEKQDIVLSPKFPPKSTNFIRSDQSAPVTEFTNNTTSANKEFDFIKSNTAPRPKNADPIAELRSFAQRNDNKTDDPPFNFQGMLRKTNFQRQSLKRSASTEVRRDSITTALNAVRRFSLKRDRDDERDDAGSTEKSVPLNIKPVFMELTPGLILEGVEVDL